MGWEVYEGEKQISPITGFGMSFKEAKEWLENYLDREVAHVPSNSICSRCSRQH